MKLKGIKLIKWTFRWLPLQQKIKIANWIVQTMKEMRATNIEGKFTAGSDQAPISEPGKLQA